VEEGSKVAEIPCCDLKYHSSCLIASVAHRVSMHMDCYCSCGGLIYQFPSLYYNNSSDLTQATAASIKEKPGVKEELKIIKQKNTAEVKACREFTSKMNEEFQKFKEDVQPHVLAIQNEKAATIHGIKQLPEYAAFRKARSSIAYSYNAFMKKHDISARVMRCIYGRRLTWRWRGPIGQIKRKFRIRF